MKTVQEQFSGVLGPNSRERPGRPSVGDCLFVAVSTGSPKQRSRDQPGSKEAARLLPGWTMQIASVVIRILAAL